MSKNDEKFRKHQKTAEPQKNRKRIEKLPKKLEHIKTSQFIAKTASNNNTPPKMDTLARKMGKSQVNRRKKC